MSIEAMKQALEALEIYGAHAGMCDQLVLLTSNPPMRKPCSCGLHKAITALRQAIAEAEKQEPVAWIHKDEETGYRALEWKQDAIGYRGIWKKIPLYTNPPKREWVGLTDKDILDALQPHYEEWEASELLDLSSEDYKLIEAKLKEKNHG